MSKKYVLKDRNTQEDVYPVTHADCVIDIPNVKSEEYIGDVEEVVGVTREELEKDLFIKLWNDACLDPKDNRYNVGKYNKQTGFFELGEIKDIPYDEAVAIYNHRWASPQSVPSSYFGNRLIRTNFPINTSYEQSINLNQAFRSSSIQIAYISSNRADQVFTVTGANFAFHASSVRKIIGRMKFPTINEYDHPFVGCTSLESFKLNNLHNSISFKDSPKIDWDSFNVMIRNATNTGKITITVHPDVYAKFTDPENTEWYELNELALTKNITFAI